jgi:hypothetical protein
MEKLSGRLGEWLLRSIATVMLFAGAAMLVAGMASSGLLTQSPEAATIAGILFQIGGLFVVAGAAAIYLSRPRGLLALPNEREEASAAERPEVGGWLIALSVALVGLPVWLVLRLLPFLAEWRRVAGFIAASRFWEGGNANGAGLVLVPIAGALVPPLFELISMAGFVVASAALLLLLLLRSPRFPRVYLVCIVLLSSLVIASVRGADAAAVARTVVEQLMESTPPRAGEDAQLRQWLDRYTGIVTSTASVLLWTLCGYLVWVPAMFLSRRVRTTFASHPAALSPSGAPDIEAITSPPRFPG